MATINFELLKIQNVGAYEAENSPICLSDEINRLAKFQLSEPAYFGFKPFQSFWRPCFLFVHPLVFVTSD